MKRGIDTVLFIFLGAIAATVSLYLYRQRESQGTAAPENNDLAVQTALVGQTGSPPRDAALPSQNVSGLATRLRGIKAQHETRARQLELKELGPSKTSVADPKEPPPQMSAAEFLAALEEAVAKADAGALSAVLEKVPSSADCVAALKGIVTASSSSGELRRYAAEALVRSGSREAVEFVLDQILSAQKSGDSGLAETLKYSLAAPTGVEGVQAMFDLLLGTGRYAGDAIAVPEDLRSTVRKAIRLAANQEAIGNVAAQYYLNLQVSGRNDALLELFDGVAHPSMLSALAVKAYQAGSAENAIQFLDHLAQSGDPGAVRAFMQTVSHEPALLNDAAEQLYAWSLKHPQLAQAGLFAEYLSDSTCTSAQRIAAAFGLAGIEDTLYAISALNKALAVETDTSVRANLVALLGFLQQGQQQK